METEYLLFTWRATAKQRGVCLANTRTGAITAMSFQVSGIRTLNLRIEDFQ
jgi:hypothetical protein